MCWHSINKIGGDCTAIERVKVFELCRISTIAARYRNVLTAQCKAIVQTRHGQYYSHRPIFSLLTWSEAKRALQVTSQTKQSDSHKKPFLNASGDVKAKFCGFCFL